MDGANEFHRGGLLRLGAVLTATSAPLRTSPVKRGDWVLRRILGTPCRRRRPMPARFPADDKLFGGLSVRQRLEAHKRNATCANCHARIDPLGFPLEHFDSTGRWRDTYADGKPIDDTGALSDKTDIAGVDGLLDYLQTQGSPIAADACRTSCWVRARPHRAGLGPAADRTDDRGRTATRRSRNLAAEIVTSQQFRISA